MRKILFRGKRLDNGAWIEGYYLGPCKTLNTTEICPVDTGNSVEVDPETVGEYAGVEKNGKPVFEGDIVEVFDKYGSVYGIVKFGETPDNDKRKNVGFYIDWLSEGVNRWQEWWRADIGFWLMRENTEIVGNIHDCKDLPALLETTE